ncbi:hypothetical protein AcV5_006666 [Taiwanofungus camphoratus]|nr:hypothetical protein AcV5_006666 [Antrodia cinnamomea]
MVASANGEVYTPFARVPIIEEGFQSSEDGSELHSPAYEGSYPPDGASASSCLSTANMGAFEEVPYSLGQLDFHSAPTLLQNSFGGRYGQSSVAEQIRNAHMLQTLQVPNSATSHDVPRHLNITLHEQSMLDYGDPSSRFQPSSLTPGTELPFSIPQNRLPQPHFGIPRDSPLFSSRTTVPVSSAVQAPQISLPSSHTKNSATANNNSSARPSRREASTVVIACRQCRARKIRCDSTRPVCHNCTRRNNECEYDAVPKRRGPDKRPGTRQRSCKKRSSDSDPSPAKKKRKTSDGFDDSKSPPSFEVVKRENGLDDCKKNHSLSLTAVHETHPHVSHSTPLSVDSSVPPRAIGSDIVYSRDGFSTPPRHRPIAIELPDSNFVDKTFAPMDVNSRRHHNDRQDKATFIHLSPSTEYSRKSWWDNLLREQPMRDIMDDLNFLFASGSYLLSFIHIPTFFRDLHDPNLRARMQPALIMSALAMAALMKSSEIELGSEGRARALRLRDTAQTMLEAACSSQSIDYTLAEAALILALFESCCHPQYNAERASCSLQFLDRIIQVLSLCSVDIHDPDATVFTTRAVPVVYLPNNYRPPKKCSCNTLLHRPSIVPFDDHAWACFTPPWDPNWSDTEVRKEECRRLCWSALALIASYTFQCSVFHQEPLAFALSEPSNYALLFPGEAYERSLGHEQLSGQSPKESVWAIYCRSMLLWSSCLRQPDEAWSTDQRSRFALEVFGETRAIQAGLNMHHCNLDSELLYLSREFLFNTCMTVTYQLRRLQDVDSAMVPMFDRRQAEEWLFYQEQVAKRIKSSVLQLGETPGHLLSRRPFQVTWFATQVVICLALWAYDRSLIHALELAKSFLIPLDVLNVLWPSPAHRHRCDELRQRLEEACSSARLPLPLPAGLTLPPILRA